MLIGRVGRQVVAVRKVDAEHHLVVVEGAEAARVNGIPVPLDGVALRPGDAIEIAGAELSFVAGAEQVEP